jgi:hypothetical protein
METPLLDHNHPRDDYVEKENWVHCQRTSLLSNTPRNENHRGSGRPDIPYSSGHKVEPDIAPRYEYNEAGGNCNVFNATR